MIVGALDSYKEKRKASPAAKKIVDDEEKTNNSTTTIRVKHKPSEEVRPMNVTCLS